MEASPTAPEDLTLGRWDSAPAAGPLDIRDGLARVVMVVRVVGMSRRSASVVMGYGSGCTVAILDHNLLLVGRRHEAHVCDGRLVGDVDVVWTGSSMDW